ncbi:MAG: hypothetical protein ACLGXA_04570, partial [Acidobacteriota bacterium]
SSDSDAKTDHSAASAAEAPLTPEQLKDSTVLDHRYGDTATVACGSRADDYLRTAAKYSFKWDDDGWLSVRFGSYLQKVSVPGVLTLVTDKVSLQNGFGAYERVHLLCDYDTQSGKVIDYNIVNPNE